MIVTFWFFYLPCIFKNFKVPVRPEIFRTQNFYVKIRSQRQEGRLKPTGNLDFSEKMVITGHPNV